MPVSLRQAAALPSFNILDEHLSRVLRLMHHFGHERHSYQASRIKLCWFDGQTHAMLSCNHKVGLLASPDQSMSFSNGKA